MQLNLFADKLFENYTNFREISISDKRVKHAQIIDLIQKRNKNIFAISVLGKSVENREIFLLKIGAGQTKIVLWSQMHGNESTGTMALFDIFNFFENKNIFIEEKAEILKNCTLYFIPMLNPDGAEVFKRRNALDIDINRDALKLATPEAQILLNFIEEIKPDFAYNLHDQDVFYSAGDTNFPATISLLTPAFNFEREIDENRIKSMQLVVSTNKILQKFIPNQVAKYSDEFMPNAFGDKVQSLGIPTLLIESGGYKNDTEKQFVRKLNFILILSGIFSISENLYKNEDFTEYEKIPFNKKNKLFNIILRNVSILKNGKKYIADIGIRQKDEIEKDVLYIDDIGDLSQNSAYEEIDFSGKGSFEDIRIGDNADGFLT